MRRRVSKEERARGGNALAKNLLWLFASSSSGDTRNAADDDNDGRSTTDLRERKDPRLSRVASSTKPLAPRTSSSPKPGLRRHFIAFNRREGARSLAEASSVGRRLDLGEQESALFFLPLAFQKKQKKKTARPLKELAPDESTPPPSRSASITQNRYSPLPRKVAAAKAGVELSLEARAGEQKEGRARNKTRAKTHRQKSERA